MKLPQALSAYGLRSHGTLGDGERVGLVSSRPRIENLLFPGDNERRELSRSTVASPGGELAGFGVDGTGSEVGSLFCSSAADELALRWPAEVSCKSGQAEFH